MAVSTAISHLSTAGALCAVCSCRCCVRASKLAAACTAAATATKLCAPLPASPYASLMTAQILQDLSTQSTSLL